MLYESSSDPARPEDTPTQTCSGPSTDPGLGRRIGPYQLLRELGHGGMGTVYLAARADEQYHKRVALKVVRGLDSAEVLRHFRRERQILAGLEHPNIARLLDGGTTEDGLPYFVMEHVEGQPIDQYCDRHALPTRQRVALFRAVCGAVEHAHRNLVVHRDIKPANILVTAEGVPKLLDFGIAKLLNPDLLADAPTATQLALTPEYASPEQARGEPITTATDVYALGVVLYELLTGHRAYRLRSRQPLEVLRAVIEEEPERPSTAVGRTEELPSAAGITITPESASRSREGTPERVRRKLQGDLDNIVLMALRKEPEKRYSSVEAFSEDLRRHLEGLPVHARKATVSYRASKFVRRNALAVLSAAALALLTLGFAISMAVQSARVSRALANAEQERAKAERVSSFLVELFHVSDPSEARGNSITAREVLDKGVEKIGAELQDQPEVRATLLNTMGSVYVSLGLYDKALPMLEEALATRRKALGGEHLDVAESLDALGHARAERGDLAGGEAFLREALALRRKLLGDDHADVSRSRNNLAVVLNERGDYAGAETLLRENLAFRRRLFGNDDPRVGRSLHNLALVLYHKGDYPAAQGLLEESLAIQRKHLGADAPTLAKTLDNLGRELDASGDHAAAEAAMREALAIRRKVLGNDHPDVGWSLSGLADALREQHRLAEAEPLYRESLRVFAKGLPPEHPYVAAPLHGLGRLLLEKGSPKAAETLLRRALEIRRRALPAGNPDIAEVEVALGACLTALSRYTEAETLLLDGYATLQTRPGPPRQEAAARLVALYEASGRSGKAGEYRALLADPSPR